MENKLKKFVDALSRTSFSIDLLPNIIRLLEQQTSQTCSSFVSHSIEPLLTLKHWAWQQLNHDDLQWIHQPDHIAFFHSFAAFNKNLIFNDDNIENQTKVSLLIPDSVDQINGIFEQLDYCTDDNSPFIVIINLWLDNLSFFIHENPQFDTLPIVCHINQYLARNYLMTNQFKVYLTQLQRQITESIFSARQLFYIKTCSFSLAAYLCANAQKFPFTAEQMLQYVGEEYLQMIIIHSHSTSSWTTELSLCIAHLTGFIHACCWWGGERLEDAKILFPTEQITCDFSQALMQIISYEPFYREIQSKRWNNQTILIDVICKFILFLIHIQKMTWFFRSNLSLPDTLLVIAENSVYDEISLYAYAMLGEILTDEKLKELQVTDNMVVIFSSMLAQGWQHPSKKYRQTPVLQLLVGFSSLAKSDAIKQKLADLDDLALFIEMSDEYPIVYDILWAISFNQDIQQKLRSNTKFMSKLIHLAKECDNEQIRKMTHGLLWNLEINHKDHLTSDIKDQETFDVMISYSHKDKILCRQIYEELVKAGYRVWIDFDQMHGNVMDAMAEAIERSQTVIICMSDEYRKSNYCRAEAQYAFQRQRKIVPILLQKHYKPDGWLLFLIGQLLYVDFIKYEFLRAMEMLFKELKGSDLVVINAVVLQPRLHVVESLPKLNLLPILPKNIQNWTETHVQSWLTVNHFVHLPHLLRKCNGRTLLHLNEYIRNGDTNLILNLLQEDSLQKTGQTLSLSELARFRSFMDEQNQVTDLDVSVRSNSQTDEPRHFACCCIL